MDEEAAALAALQGYLTSVTAKDCGIIISLQRVVWVGEGPEPEVGEEECMGETGAGKVEKQQVQLQQHQHQHQQHHQQHHQQQQQLQQHQHQHQQHHQQHQQQQHQQRPQSPGSPCGKGSREERQRTPKCTLYPQQASSQTSPWYATQQPHASQQQHVQKQQQTHQLPPQQHPQALKQQHAPKLQQAQPQTKQTHMHIQQQQQHSTQQQPPATKQQHVPKQQQQQQTKQTYVHTQQQQQQQQQQQWTEEWEEKGGVAEHAQRSAHLLRRPYSLLKLALPGTDGRQVAWFKYKASDHCVPT
jgi:hypothetical protein